MSSEFLDQDSGQEFVIEPAKEMTLPELIEDMNAVLETMDHALDTIDSMVNIQKDNLDKMIKLCIPSK